MMLMLMYFTIPYAAALSVSQLMVYIFAFVELKSAKKSWCVISSAGISRPLFAMNSVSVPYKNHGFQCSPYQKATQNRGNS